MIRNQIGTITSEPSSTFGPGEALAGVVLEAVGRQAGCAHQLVDGDAEMRQDGPHYE